MFSMDAFTTVVLGWVIAIIIVTFGCFAAMLLSFMSEEDEQCEWCGNTGAVANGPDKARICPLCRATFQGMRVEHERYVVVGRSRSQRAANATEAK